MSKLAHYNGWYNSYIPCFQTINDFQGFLLWKYPFYCGNILLSFFFFFFCETQFLTSFSMRHLVLEVSPSLFFPHVLPAGNGSIAPVPEGAQGHFVNGQNPRKNKSHHIENHTASSHLTLHSNSQCYLKTS